MPFDILDSLDAHTIDALAAWAPTAGAAVLAAMTAWCLSRYRLIRRDIGRAHKDIKTLAKGVNDQTEIIRSLRSEMYAGGAGLPPCPDALDQMAELVADTRARVQRLSRETDRIWGTINGDAEANVLHSMRRAKDEACEGR